MIDLLPDDEQQSIVDAVASFLMREMPVGRLRPKPGSRDAPALPDPWPKFAEMGWLTLGIPESLAGAGYSVAELMLVFREFGRYLLSPSLVAATVAGQLAASANPAMATKLAEGTLRTGLAVLTLTSADDQTFLLLDPDCDIFVVVGDAISIYEGKAFENIERIKCLDSSIELARACLVGDCLSRSEDSGLADETRILVCAMLVGNAEATRDLAVEYAKVREQFGRPIGGFQAIKHKCADMAVRAEAAMCQTTLAALTLKSGAADGRFQVNAAIQISAAMAIANAEEAIQIHGGTGYTLECDVHLFIKRAHVLDCLLGPARQRRANVLDLLVN
jgi:alkylation response protein AidB-like acyl-CoA dehydrogenase